MEGVIIGPQQPGTVMYSMRPPSLTGPSISLLGPTMSVYRSTTTKSWARSEVSSTVMGRLLGASSSVSVDPYRCGCRRLERRPAPAVLVLRKYGGDEARDKVEGPSGAGRWKGAN